MVQHLTMKDLGIKISEKVPLSRVICLKVEKLT